MAVMAEPDETSRSQADHEETPGEWTPERRREYRLALERRRVRQVRVSQVLAFVLILTVAAGVVFRLPESWWMPAVGAIALLGAGFRLANWKCPDCGERLPSRRSRSICLGCGAPLD